ncbi:MAG: DnaB-like helicase N-terminal domain-containing protein, partial [Bacilli bacterium]
MPHNIEVEQCVLGSMFLSDQAAKKCVENLSSELFYKESHKKIFEV